MREFGEAPKTIFENMDALNPNEAAYRPHGLPERQTELDEVHSALRPVELGSTPINLLVYGETGQGKTVGIDLKTRQLREWANGNGVDLTVVTIGCKGLDKSYNVMIQLLKSLREERHGPGEETPRGFQKKELFQLIMAEMEKIGGTIIVVLDEIDSLGEDDYILYELPRADINGVKLSVIGITNDLTYTENLDSDVRSSLGEEEVTFPPYQSDQLRAILARRSEIALRDTGFSCADCADPSCPHDVEKSPENLVSDVIESGVIPKASAISAQDTGDARRALRLLFRASRFADDRGETKITEAHVAEAKEYLEEKAVVNGIQTLTDQKKVSLMAVVYGHVVDETPIPTDPLYGRYKKYCRTASMDPVSNRQFRVFLKGLEGNGLIHITPGRGRTPNRYRLDVDADLIIQNLPRSDDRLGQLADNIREKWR